MERYSQKFGRLILQTPEFFLGLPIEGSLQSALRQVNPGIYRNFVNKAEYLFEVSHESQNYLGKPVGMIVKLSQLEMSEAHVRSLFLKIIPDFPIHSHPLYLFPIFNGI